MKDKTHGEVYKEWGDKREKKITYKNKVIYVRVLPHPKEKNGRAFYIGTYYPYKVNRKLSSTIESIHYDKVVSKFERFVDEYCTDWEARANVPYKGYIIKIDQEKDKEFYIGYVQFHKNSIYKHIAEYRDDVERCCKSRINRVLKGKEKIQRKMLTPKQEKIQELEQLLARISAQLEELKKEKDTLTYKGVVLELVDDPIYKKGILRDCGMDTPAPFTANSLEDLKKFFEIYVDKLEKYYNLYRKLTGKES